MQCMLPTELAKFIHFKFVRTVFPVLNFIIISLLAFTTSYGNLCSHVLHPLILVKIQSHYYKNEFINI